MKRVLIATPCLDGRVEAYYVNSLYESVKLGLQHDIMLQPVFLAYESILPMARNELIALCYKENYDAMVFIDDDESWPCQGLINILLSEKDVISLPVVNKGDDKIQYNVFFDDNTQKDTLDGYISVDTVGTGFLKLSRRVVVDLYNNEEDSLFRGKILKNVCEYRNQDNKFVGEDITLCRKIKNLNYAIWVDPTYTVEHIGSKKFRGDFARYISLNKGLYQ
jgi:hypothetical protein